MAKTVVVLATLDTKGPEAAFVREQIERWNCQAVLVNIGVVGDATIDADYDRAAVAEAGGSSLDELLNNPTREAAAPVMVRGATKIVSELVTDGKAHAVIGLGGTQGTSSASGVMQQLPYGLPKLIVSTCAAGDTSPFVGIKDIMMMFSVSDILGLNPFMKKVLSNAAAAVCGMAQVEEDVDHFIGDKPLIGMTNLGVLTNGAIEAVDYLEQHGYEVIVFHAVGAGGRAMEQMMKEGLIQAVFDYGLGEIPDELHHSLRAGGPERLTVAGKLGLPQVICPGGAEHIGILLDEPYKLPEKYANHQNVFHSSVIAAPRLEPDELVEVAKEIGKRLQHTKGNAAFMIPLQGVSRYAIEGGPLRNEESDAVFFKALKDNIPPAVEVVEIDAAAEDPQFVHACCDRLLAMIEAK